MDRKFKEVINKLEQLVLKAEKDKNKIEDAYLEGDNVVDKGELLEAEAYLEGVFQAFAVVKKTFEGDYE